MGFAYKGETIKIYRGDPLLPESTCFLDFVSFAYLDPKMFNELCDMIALLYVTFILPNTQIRIYRYADRNQPVSVEGNSLCLYIGGMPLPQVKAHIEEFLKSRQEEGIKKRIAHYKNNILFVHEGKVLAFIPRKKRKA